MTAAQLTDLSAKKAARHLLADKFDAVRKHLLAVFDTPTEAERIHKLRVAVRRATAAVDAFAPCLPPRQLKQAKRVLRTIRRTAGAARDWDVFFPVVTAWVGERSDSVRPFADALLGWSAAKRDSAQAGLAALAEAFPAALDELAETTVAAVRRPKDGLSVADIAHRRVEALQAELAAACEHEPATDAEFHQVRIVGKRLRYAAELFADHIPDAERIDADMRALQDVLGRLNDGVVGANHLGEFERHFQQFHPAEWERLQPGAEALGGHFAAARDAERERFREWRRSQASRVA